MTDAILTTTPLPPQTNANVELTDPTTALINAEDAATTDAMSGKNVGAMNSMKFNGSAFDRDRTASVFKPQSAVSVASETTVWTPASGKRFRLMAGIVTCSVAGNLTFKDNTAGTVIAIIPVLAGAPVSFDFKNGILSAAANNVLTCTGPASSTLSGVVYGTEE